jgi:hypothetical protein
LGDFAPDAALLGNLLLRRPTFFILSTLVLPLLTALISFLVHRLPRPHLQLLGTYSLAYRDQQQTSNAFFLSAISSTSSFQLAPSIKRFAATFVLYSAWHLRTTGRLGTQVVCHFHAPFNASETRLSLGRYRLFFCVFKRAATLVGVSFEPLLCIETELLCMHTCFLPLGP